MWPRKASIEALEALVMYLEFQMELEEGKIVPQHSRIRSVLGLSVAKMRP